MPFHRPIPEDKLKAGSQKAFGSQNAAGSQNAPGARPTPGLHSLVQAEKVMQIAFILPCAMLVGWGMGWCFDHFVHTHWATVVGLVLGLIAGMFSVIQTAMAAMQSLSGRADKGKK
jgi:F0F1-type ATP synthase assembly protein I